MAGDGMMISFETAANAPSISTTVVGPPVPIGVTTALRRAGLLRDDERVQGISRFPNDDTIHITVEGEPVPMGECATCHERWAACVCDW